MKRFLIFSLLVLCSCSFTQEIISPPVLDAQVIQSGVRTPFASITWQGKVYTLTAFGADTDVISVAVIQGDITAANPTIIASALIDMYGKTVEWALPLLNDQIKKYFGASNAPPATFYEQIAAALKKILIVDKGTYFELIVQN